MQIDDTKLVNSKTKKIAKKETESLNKRKRKKKRIKYLCNSLNYNLKTKQILSNPKDQVWRIKFSSNGKYIVGATKSYSLYCWKQK